MDRVVAGTVIRAGACGEDDITAANLNEMADTIETQPLTEADRRELVSMLRWLAQLVDEIDQADRSSSTDLNDDRRRREPTSTQGFGRARRSASST